MRLIFAPFGSAQGQRTKRTLLSEMPSSTKCGVRLTDVLWTWLSGDLTRLFPETIHLSGERPTGEERLPCITSSGSHRWDADRRWRRSRLLRACPTTERSG